MVHQSNDEDERLGSQLESFRPRLRRMIGLRIDPRLRARVDASDVLQETYVEVTRRLDEYQRAPEVPFFIWVRFLAGQKLVEFHRQQKTLATLTAVQPPGRFGAFPLGRDQDKITSFREKPSGDGAWVNGGFFVIEPTVLDYIQDDGTVWEREPLTYLAHLNQLSAYKHSGFWQPMDTLRDKTVLDEMWQSGEAPWKVWP